MAVNFFNPEVPEGLVGAQWDVQSSNPSTTRERAASLGSDGDETASFLYGEKTTINVSCSCNAATGTALTVPSVGSVVSGYHIDTVNLTFTATAQPTMDITAHKHALNKSHEGTHRTYSLPAAIKETLKAGVGVPVGIAGIKLTDLAGGLSQVTIALTANHVEAPYTGTPPTIPASDNHDGSVTITVEVVGDEQPATPAGFDLTDESTTNGNTTNDSRSFTYIQHVAHDE